MSLLIFICHCYFLGLSVLYLCLLQNQSNYDLFNMGSLQRVTLTSQPVHFSLTFQFVLRKNEVVIPLYGRVAKGMEVSSDQLSTG